MMLKLTIVGIAAMCAFTLSAQETKSQWDGIYTMEQAKRGEQLFADKCASCHGQDLTGGDMGPALVGAQFAANWNDFSLGDLFEQIRTSMPQDAPGGLSPQRGADALAFILYKGKYPAGATELPNRTAVLKPYKFLATNPARK